MNGRKRAKRRRVDHGTVWKRKKKKKKLTHLLNFLSLPAVLSIFLFFTDVPMLCRLTWTLVEEKKPRWINPILVSPLIQGVSKELLCLSVIWNLWRQIARGSIYAMGRTKRISKGGVPYDKRVSRELWIYDSTAGDISFLRAGEQWLHAGGQGGLAVISPIFRI